MGEVMLNGGDSRRMEFSREVKEIEMENDTNNNSRNDAAGAGASTAAANSSAVRFESFLPKMTLRVLLVEADDSTRQIIAALLRKCNYRVAAVADGLKAWEVLKGRPQNIDLILTEVDLPSISGFALLTLIMEHRVCKNIPVIMMSSQDSVSTVYKCMLKGAADFLVKPVRKNELRNLWQHVWRRQASSSSGIGPPDESIAQGKVEATAENNNTSNCSSDNMACIQTSREGLEKGSDAQSSCTKPELEAEGPELECAQGLSHPKWSKPSSSKSIPTNIGHGDLTNEVQDYHVAANGSQVTAGILADRNFQEDSKLDDHWVCFNASSQANRDSKTIRHSSREAIDLIGAFDNPLKFMKGSCSSNAGINNFDSPPLLDLSLKRSLPCSSVNQVTDERPRLNHSDASAFSRYVNKTPRPGHSTSPITYNRPDNQEADSDKQFSNQTVNRNSDPCGLAVTSPRSTRLASGQHGQHGETENRFSLPNCRLLPSPIPVRGLRFENVSGAYGSFVPPARYTHSSMSQIQSTASVNHQEGSFQVSFNPVNHLIGDPQPSCNAGSQNADDANDQSENVDMKRLESTEDRGHLSSATEQSANSAFCNGVVAFPNLSLGSNGKLDPLSAAEFEEAFRANDGSSVRSLQREAALTKFRLKRKERCFEKKVRYESRKKLAEKRPRIKGQFVRQVSNETPSGKSSGL